jgi:Mg-chelatase subunit ChlD
MSVVNVLVNKYVVKIPKDEPSFIQYLDFAMTPEGAATRISSKPLQYIILLDKSGSMREKMRQRDGGAIQKLDRAKEALIELLGVLPENSKLTLLTFGGVVTPVFDNMTYRSSKKYEFEEEINRIEVSGDTPMMKAFQEAIRIAEPYSGEYIPRILLVTDGRPTDNRNVNSYKKRAESLLESGVAVDTIGVGDKHHVHLLTTISGSTRGKYVYVEDNILDLPVVIKDLAQIKTAVLVTPVMELQMQNLEDQVVEAYQYEPTHIPYIIKDDPPNSIVYLRALEPGKVCRFIVKFLCQNPSVGQEVHDYNMCNVVIKEQEKSVFNQQVTIDFVDGPGLTNPQIQKIAKKGREWVEAYKQATVKGDPSLTQRYQGEETKRLK